MLDYNPLIVCLKCRTHTPHAKLGSFETDHDAMLEVYKCLWCGEQRIYGNSGSYTDPRVARIEGWSWLAPFDSKRIDGKTFIERMGLCQAT
jgi:hypothetical protein